MNNKKQHARTLLGLAVLAGLVTAGQVQAGGFATPTFGAEGWGRAFGGGSMFKDDLCVNLEGDGVLTQMVKLYNQYRCTIIAIQEVDPAETNKYGVIAGDLIGDDLYRVRNMVEKPAPEDAPSNLAIIGRYILTPDIFELIKQTEPGKGGEIQITDALMKQAQNGCVIAYKFKGKRFDCGGAEGYIEATNFCFENFYKTGKAY